MKEIYDKERIICKLPFLSTYVFGQYHKQACDMHGYKNEKVDEKRKVTERFGCVHE